MQDVLTLTKDDTSVFDKDLHQGDYLSYASEGGTSNPLSGVVLNDPDLPQLDTAL